MSKPPCKSETENTKPQFHSLSDETSETLIDLLGLDPSVNPNEHEKAAQVTQQVEQILGLYWRNLEGIKALADAKPRGRPKQEVLQKAIGDLRKTFRRYYGEVDNKRKTRGPISSLSPAENDEREFIHLSLKAAGVSHTGLKKLRRSYDKQGTPLADRNKVITIITDEAERRAKKPTPKGDKSKH